MGRRSRATFKKRQKELARQQKQQDKEAQRRARSERRGSKIAHEGEEDPDIGGIRPGPQPLPAEWNYVPDRPKTPSDDET